MIKPQYEEYTSPKFVFSLMADDLSGLKGYLYPYSISFYDWKFADNHKGHKVYTKITKCSGH